MKRTLGAVASVALTLMLAACGTSAAPVAASPDCLPMPDVRMDIVMGNAALPGSEGVRGALYPISDEMYLMAVEFDAPGAEGTVAVFITPRDTVAGPVRPVDSFAEGFFEWGPISDGLQTAVGRDAINTARACLTA